MAFLRPLTANKNPHPAPVAHLADQSGRDGEWGYSNRLEECHCTERRTLL
jgi:hypothetical protein